MRSCSRALLPILFILLQDAHALSQGPSMESVNKPPHPSASLQHADAGRKADAGLAVQAYDTSNPYRMNATLLRDAECKTCPYGTCLNVDIVRAKEPVQFQCYTNGDVVGQSKVWLRHQFGARQDLFCYVNSFDVSTTGEYDAKLPYCGTKSELHLFVPTVQTKTVYYTECSLCPYRDCEGIKYYQSGSILDINCHINDGWQQLGPLHPEGSKKYYRTQDNCYVSAQHVADPPARVISQSGAQTQTLEQLPPCGPVPVLRAADRPNLVDGSFVPSRPVSAIPTPVQVSPDGQAAAPSRPPVPVIVPSTFRPLKEDAVIRAVTSDGLIGKEPKANPVDSKGEASRG